MDKITVLVTGATGLVGYHAVKHLLAKGFAVKALTRSSSNIADLNSLATNGQLSIVQAELDDKSQLVNCLKGVDVVVHAAGFVDPLGKREDIYKVNVDGTGNMLAAAKEANVKQFIHISSLSVITGQGDQYGLSEKAELKYCGEPYADSKVDAEKLVATQNGTIHVTVLRPGFIYGPKEKAWMPRLINSIAQGKAMLIDGGLKETNVIYVGNLTQAIELAILNKQSYGQVYNLTDGEKVSKKELFDAIADGLSLPRVTRTIPTAVARTACEVVSTIAPMLPLSARKGLSRYSRAAFRLAGVNQGFDISKAERELNYTKRISFADGMKETLADFGSKKKVKS
ncbi:MAG: NAD-dependent epimerase/dehydratase family protein [Candidatus Obscuribacterales bacterium]|nr:NAD-dependent epimerase/dehydratase family protein [Candidatus Obscuribacterales bacterium]